MSKFPSYSNEDITTSIVIKDKTNLNTTVLRS